MPSPSPGPEKPKRKRGRPPEDSRFEPTAEQRQLVEAGCGLGIPEDELVRVVINPKTKAPISPVTLRKYFKAELHRGHVQTKMRVGMSLVRSALGVAPTEHHAGYAGNVTAQIFYLKTQAGWKEGAPPPEPTDLEAPENLEEAARRIAFALAAGERAATKSLPAPKREARPKTRQPA